MQTSSTSLPILKRLFWALFALTIGLYGLRTIAIRDVCIDEVAYVAFPYSLALGKKMVAESTLMHAGASVPALALWLFTKIFSPIEAIWLFNNCIFVISLLVAGIVIFKIFARQYGALFAAALALICATYVALYPVLFYDSVGAIGLLFASICAYQSKQVELVNSRHAVMWSFPSGMAIAVMVLAYPSMALFLPYFLILLLWPSLAQHPLPRKKAFSTSIGLSLGVIFVFLTFCLYVLGSVGLQDFITGLTARISDTKTLPVWSLDDPPQFSPLRIVSFAQLALRGSAYLAAAGLMVFVATTAANKIITKRWNWKTALVASIILAPLAVIPVKGPRQPGFVATFYACGACLLYLLTPNKSPSIHSLARFMLLPSVLAQFIYGSTATRPSKFIYGHYGALLVLSLFALAFLEPTPKAPTDPCRAPNPYRNALIPLAVAFSLVISYATTAQFSDGTLPQLWNKLTWVASGPLKGLLAPENQITHTAQIKKHIDTYAPVNGDVFFGEYHKIGYLMARRAPLVSNEWGSIATIRDDRTRLIPVRSNPGDLNTHDSVRNIWKEALRDFHLRKKLPALIVVHPIEIQNHDAGSFFHDKYHVVYEGDTTIVLALNGDPSSEDQ